MELSFMPRDDLPGPSGMIPGCVPSVGHLESSCGLACVCDTSWVLVSPTDAGPTPATVTVSWEATKAGSGVRVHQSLGDYGRDFFPVPCAPGTGTAPP